MSERGQVRFLKGIVITLLMFGLLCSVAFYWFQTTINSSAIAAKCQQRIERTVDPIALQAWATNLLRSHSPSRTNYLGPFEPPENLKGIWKRSTPGIYIKPAPAGGNEDYVYVFWGTGVMGHWGLSIGSPTFVPNHPTTGSQMWKPGIYFWVDLH